jgi:hypothetical protein
MRTGFAAAMRVQAQRVVCDLKALGACDVVLTAFDFGIEELFHPTAVQTNQMVVVLPLVELIDGFAAFKLAAASANPLVRTASTPGKPWPSQCRRVRSARSRYTSSALMWRCATFLEQLQRWSACGTVAFKPVFFKSLRWTAHVRTLSLQWHSS